MHETRAAVDRSFDAKDRIAEALSLTGVTKIWRRDATKLGEAGTLAPFDLVFLDPPFDSALLQPAADALRPWLADAAWVYVELPSRAAFLAPPGWSRWPSMPKRLLRQTAMEACC